MDAIIRFIRQLYDEPEGFIPLHAPVFTGREKEYLARCIDTTFVSSVGEYVTRFEEMTRDFTGAARAVAVVNGTCGLTAALSLVGVGHGDLVLSQALTFVATANAISNTGATPIFLDSDPDTLGMSPDALRAWFAANPEKIARVKACVPVHILGHACRIREICAVCDEHAIPVVEDAAEGLGSFLNGQHLGTFGRLGVLSYNGNKTITTGGGGMILAGDEDFGNLVKHRTATAKVPHRWEFRHDAVAWNYRMPNINAALGCAQMEKLDEILADKRVVAAAYRDFFADVDGVDFVDAPPGCLSNFWLNTVLFRDREARDAFLALSNDAGVMTRPLWALMADLPMYADNDNDGLKNARELSARAVNLPSGPRLKA
ncbi:DegT/DnrJ/EryC1/StrS aminotransferase [Pseudodesulfovibrio mercurii]|uniref:DegT/DnrJ/EryC1/StrS aminotransferase n=1 Tax=Pseudodesulfovibrio mercurii TaxID=641491 RepID=F0JH55_9BACT|nr:LegC family aminotransferase [Pseudodesulfovibrio mercurii]EGB13994.1 DegT/DnrJ/EryC1/StrS aminotransferase [Pseudodesulfovibrio mercurii]